MSSSNSPCAACKCLRRKCTQECVYAPFFPPDQPQKFINVHKVFGASNVAKLLNELPASQREDAVSSLAYEADYRLQDPVYGCVGLISILQSRLKQVQYELYNAKKELTTYIGPSAMLPIMQQGLIQQQQQQQHANNNPSSSAVMPFNMQPMMAATAAAAAAPLGAQIIMCDPQQQQMVEAQQMAAAREQQELFRGYERQQQQQPQQQQQQQELMRFNGGFDVAYNQMGGATSMSPSLVLGSYESVSYNHLHQQQQQQPHETTLQSHEQMAAAAAAALNQQNRQQQEHVLAMPHRAKSEDGPSC